MSYLISFCVSFILTAAAVSARYDIFDFDIPANVTNGTDDGTTLRDTAEENLCAYVGLNCSDNTNTIRPETLTRDSVVQDIVDMLASVEEYFNHNKDYGFERYNSTNGRKVLGLFLDSPKTKELIRKRSETNCFSSINEKFVNIIHQKNITQDFNNFITSSPFDGEHCVTALIFNNMIKYRSENTTDCNNQTLSIVFDVFEDVRVHLKNCTFPEPEDADSVTVAKSSWMIVWMMSLLLVKIIY